MYYMFNYFTTWTGHSSYEGYIVQSQLSFTDVITYSMSQDSSVCMTRVQFPKKERMPMHTRMLWVQSRIYPIGTEALNEDKAGKG